MSGSRIDAARHDVPEDLADLIETGWSGAWDLPEGAPHTTELLSDPATHIVCELGAHEEARVVGPWSSLWTRTLQGRGRIHGVKLLPGAVRACFDVQAAELCDRIHPLADFCDDAGALLHAVRAAEAHRAGVDPLYAWVRARRRPEPGTQTAIDLVRQIRESTISRVDALAASSGLSVRAIQRLFRAHVGLSPKSVIRRHRLQEVASRVEHGQAPTLGDLAYMLGYSDQAHLARDFRAATGRSLSTFEANLDAPPGD